MTDREALLRAILDNPADDAVRLIYADCLEEHGGESDRLHAELIRVQIELGILGEPTESPQHSTNADPRCECPRCSLRKRELDILALPCDPECSWHAPLPHGGCDWGFSRGFMEVVRCPAEVWLRLGDAIRERH